MTIIAPAPAAHADLDAAVTELREGAARWAVLGPIERADLLGETHAATARVAKRWAETAAAAKGLSPEDELAAEEWLTGPYAVLEGLAAYRRSLLDLAEHGTTLTGARFRPAPGGRVAVRVLPESLAEWVLFNGFTADVWLPPGVTEAQARAEAGPDRPAPRGSDGTGAAKRGGVGLVLGAGNITSIGPLDVLWELVAHGRASILKLNPTFDALLPVYRAALEPLIQLGVARVVLGGAETGGFLAAHPGIDHVHITGSAATHDRIVWGDGADAARRRAADEPRLVKPITSELGGVAPVIVVPGRWSRADLRHQAEHVATMRLHNAGHNCIAAQDLILSDDWPQRRDFLIELRLAFNRIAARRPWYPGSQAKLDQARRAHPLAETHRGRLLIAVPADSPDELFEVEYFAPVLGVTSLPGTGADFLRAAVDFSNERLAGTLGANVIVRPADRAAMGEAFDAAIADLRYGTIAINAWTGVAFGLARASWGAYPGHTLADVGSGIGVVHNGHLIRNPERTVLNGPFQRFPLSLAEGSLFPRPPWFVTSRSALATAKAMTEYAKRPGVLRLLGALVAAFRA